MSLVANRILYETCLAEARRAAINRRGDAHDLVEMVARFAWKQHPGRFADGALENLLLTGKLPFRSAAAGPPSAFPGPAIRPHGVTLHVATEVYPTGGHSRVLTKWMQRDRSSDSALVLTRQRLPIPEFLRRIWDESGVRLLQLDPDQPVDARASILHSVSRGAERIVLHQHPDDAVPVRAYASDKPVPVLMFNHAHFSFSMGTTVADLVLNTLPYYGHISLARRHARRVDYLNGPFGLEPVCQGSIDKDAAKRALSLPGNCRVAMTIGTQNYFRPVGDVDFFSFVRRLLDTLGDVYFLFVGVNADFQSIPPELRVHGRVRFCGDVPDPRPYYQAADVCVESFPMPSLAASTEAVMFGESCPVLSFSDGENIIRPGIPWGPGRPRDAEEHFSETVRLLSDPARARESASLMRGSMLAAEDGFGAQFERLYELAEGARSAVAPIPESSASGGMDDRILVDMCGDRFMASTDDIPRRGLRLKCLVRGLAARQVSLRELSLQRVLRS